MRPLVLGPMVALLLTPAQAAPLLIPRPQEIEEHPGAFPLADGTRIAVLPADDRDLRFATDMAAEELKGKRAADGTILVGLPMKSERFAALCREAGCLPDQALGDQGYMLLVTPERVIIAANESAGAFYGVQTLLQLARIGGGHEIPCVRIRDWPALKWRGVLTDQSRQAVPKVETYKRMIRELSRYKINFVSMHLEHTFVVEKHPIISAGTGALTAVEAREICEYARQYHCLFFPSFEAFGHQSHIFKHPEYSDLAESDWKYSFAPTEEGTYRLLSDILDEMCPAFTGTEFFNAGSDEVGDLGAGKSKELADRIGKAALYAQHMNRVYDLLKARGKRMMMWGDMLLQHPEAMDLIPKDTIIMDWHYGPARDYPSITQFREKGFEVFVVPALSSWCRLFPDYDLALENMEWLIRRGREQGAIGSMTCNWGDDGNENLIANCYYGWLFAAECSWGAQKESVDGDLFDRAFCRQFFGTRSTAPARAIHALVEANKSLNEDTTFPWRFYHDDPFAGRLRRAWPSSSNGSALTAAAVEVRRRLRDMRVGRNADVLEAMAYSAGRLLFAGLKCELVEGSRQAYERAYTGREPEGVQRALEGLTLLRRQLERQRDEFVTWWNRENRPEGIDYNLRRFDAQLASLDEQLQRLGAAIDAGTLAEPAALGLDDPRFYRCLPLRRGDLPHSTDEWRVKSADLRVRVRIEAGGHTRVDAPILTRVPDELFRSGGPLTWLHIAEREVLTQTVHEQGGPALAFVLPGKLEARDAIEGDLYVGAEASRPSLERWNLTPEGGRLIRTDTYETTLGREGAHLYSWKVAKLNGLDVTQPGESGWAGFFDDPRYRTLPFTLFPLTDGPVLVKIGCHVEHEHWRTYYFWKALPYVECIFSNAASTTWAFDSTANFAADAPMPGTAHLSNGFSGPVPRSDEQRQVPEGGAQAWWCCKTRADGLTLGLITPAEQTRMRVGPGGGWGGVGIEGSNPCQYFVVYCDVDPRGPTAVEEVYHTLARDDPITVTFGKPEARP